MFYIIILLFTAPTGKPIPTAAHNTSSTSVYISWKPPPPDTILGEFLGYRITYRPRDRNPNDTKEIYIRDATIEVNILRFFLFKEIKLLDIFALRKLHLIKILFKITPQNQT